MKLATHYLILLNLAPAVLLTTMMYRIVGAPLWLQMLMIVMAFITGMSYCIAIVCPRQRRLEAEILHASNLVHRASEALQERREQLQRIYDVAEGHKILEHDEATQPQLAGNDVGTEAYRAVCRLRARYDAPLGRSGKYAVDPGSKPPEDQ